MDGLSGKDGLINVNDSVVVIFQKRNRVHQIEPPILILNIFGWIDQLDLFYLLPLDLMKSIELSKKGRINVMIAKMTMEKETPSFQ